jgi:hypothetical protein
MPVGFCEWFVIKFHKFVFNIQKNFILNCSVCTLKQSELLKRSFFTLGKFHLLSLATLN